MRKITICKENNLMVLRATNHYKYEDLLEWKHNNVTQLNQLLYERGAILFRGFNISNTEIFESFMNQLPDPRLAYIDGNSPRKKLLSNIYTSTEFPSEYPISLHNELSYSSSWPTKLYFCCVVPPATDGHTLLADSRKVLQDLEPSIVEQFSNRQVKYTRFLHDGLGIGLSWQETFESHEKHQVEEYCDNADIEYQWNKDGGLHLSQIGPGTILHPITNEKVWFNQADQFHISNLPDKVASTIKMLTKENQSLFPTYSYFGDGEEISPEIFLEVRNVFKKNTVYFSWEAGDILLVDNVLTAHGRSPFSGNREIIVAMT